MTKSEKNSETDQIRAGPPLLIELEQVHECSSVSVSDKMKDSKLKWLATLTQDQDSVTSLFELTCNNPREYVEKIKKHHTVKDAKIVSLYQNRAEIIISVRNDHSTAKHLSKSGTTWIEPTWSEGGVDHVTMFAPNFNSFKEFLASVEGHYDLKIKAKRYIDQSTKISFDTFRSAGFMQMKLASELLTDRQMEAFDLACRYGYYENPKKISLNDLAQKMDISEPTVGELLRKSEKKLLPILSEIIKILR